MSSIPSLLNICLEFVSDNPYSLSATVFVTGDQRDIVTESALNGNKSRQLSYETYRKFVGKNFVFRNDIFFPENIAEKLITLLSKKGKLNDGTMKLFERETTRLR